MFYYSASPSDGRVIYSRNVYCSPAEVKVGSSPQGSVAGKIQDYSILLRMRDNTFQDHTRSTIVEAYVNCTGGAD